jgi:YVTN family beta-propeller protein
MNARILLAIALLPLPPPPEARQKLYVTNSAGNDIHIIDVSTHQVLGRLEVGPEPHGIAASAAGDQVFLTIENMSGEAGELVWLDPRSDRITRRMKVGPKPNQLAVTPDGKIAYIPCEDGTYWVVDTVRGEVLTKIKTGGRPHNTLCSPDGRHMYLAPMGAPRQITICDTTTHAVVGQIPFSDSIRPIALSADEKRFYAHVDGLIGFEVADIPSRKRIYRIEAAAPEDLKRLDSRSHGLGLRPDQKELYMCDVYRSLVHVFDLSVDPPRECATLRMAGPVYWLCFSPDGKYCYVSQRQVNQVAAIDTSKKAIVAQMPVGHAPKRILTLTLPE